MISVLDEQLEAVDCPMKAQMQLDVAVEEIYTNISNYAYGEAEGEVFISMEVTPDFAKIVFMDSGNPFNPLEVDEPDVVSDAQSEKMGGLGIYMVRQSMDEVTYEYKDGKNQLSIKKNLQ